MAQDVFLLVLAALTAAAGVTLLIMVMRRRRARKLAAALEAAATAAEAAAIEEQDSSRRTIDDYAIPVSFESPQRTHDDEDDIGKICPACGARYGSHHQVCVRDNSELAALN